MATIYTLEEWFARESQPSSDLSQPEMPVGPPDPAAGIDDVDDGPLTAEDMDRLMEIIRQFRREDAAFALEQSKEEVWSEPA